jgi:hypothetical protein
MIVEKVNSRGRKRGEGAEALTGTLVMVRRYGICSHENIITAGFIFQYEISYSFYTGYTVPALIKDDSTASAPQAPTAASLMSFGRPPTFSSFQATAPDRGSFPLDHDGIQMPLYLRASFTKL